MMSDHEIGGDLVLLSPAESRLVRGLLATHQFTLLRDLRKGGLTATGAAQYRADLATAGTTLVKLGGVSVAAEALA